MKLPEVNQTIKQTVSNPQERKKVSYQENKYLNSSHNQPLFITQLLRPTISHPNALVPSDRGEGEWCAKMAEFEAWAWLGFGPSFPDAWMTAGEAVVRCLESWGLGFGCARYAIAVHVMQRCVYVGMLI